MKYKTPILHRFIVTPQPTVGDYLIMFPLLVGCGVIVNTLEEIGPAALQEYQRWMNERRSRGEPTPPSDLLDDTSLHADTERFQA